ncbi:hypothetical protein AMAG_16173 [Allomyces macrogynus ATCC 38327]|uniref:Nicotinamide-nucleotide adenylyltransferase n=1 Tax=Allomyces macrogynus (strain ATCC 38327) TaxID=578462 RepID=A0A0L0TA44_ALLM3|nr:hypothetical protein AMAG_16173 [Allomyces macrogynus ATCC 38327]|eukprot:KNE71612.1 hypothetical protein AMAG_16173 [Allomyces macrogynus ATCC 38327]
MNIWFRSCPAWPWPCRASSAAAVAALRAAPATTSAPLPPRTADSTKHAACQPDQVNDETPRRPVRVTILDSSHNPPNAAHVALLRAALQPSLARASANEPDNNESDAVDAVLILLAVQNADKGRLAESDLAHRLAMMREVALDTHEWLAAHAPAATTTELPSIAVATTDHALFKDKAADVLALLPPSAHLRWVLGEDTLLRIFDPKYYPATSVADTMTAFFDATRSTFLWARRPALPIAANVDRDALDLCRARGFVEDLVLDPGVALAIRDVSSTSVRDAVASGEWAAVERGTVPGVTRYIREHGLYGAE